MPMHRASDIIRSVSLNRRRIHHRVNIEDYLYWGADARQKYYCWPPPAHPDINACQQCIRIESEFIRSIFKWADQRQCCRLWPGNITSVAAVAEPVRSIIRHKSASIAFFITEQTMLEQFQQRTKVWWKSFPRTIGQWGDPCQCSGFNLFTSMKTLATFRSCLRWCTLWIVYCFTAHAWCCSIRKIDQWALKIRFRYSLPGGKTAVPCGGENFWKWRLYDYVINTIRMLPTNWIAKPQHLAAKKW